MLLDWSIETIHSPNATRWLMRKLFSLFFFSLALLNTACVPVVPSVNAIPRIQSRSKVDVYSNYVFVKNASSADSVQISLCGVRLATLTAKVDTANVQLPYRLCGVNAKVYLQGWKYGTKFGWAMNNYQTNYVTGNYYYGSNYPHGCQYVDWIVTDGELNPKGTRYQSNPSCASRY